MGWLSLLSKCMFKWFLYSLILFNIGFFAWNWRTATPMDKIIQYDESDGATKLLLLKEQANKEHADKLPITKTSECFSVGPFAGKTETSAAQKKLAKWRIDTKLRVVKTTAEGFWVIIPSFETRKMANLQVKKLKELGVKDYFLVTTGSQKNAISLGVFSKSSSAKRRLAEMKTKGVKATITAVDLPKRSYWLDWPVSQTPLTAEQLNLLQKTFQGVGKVSINCTL